MEKEKVFKCLEMGVIGGILSRSEADEAREFFENSNNSCTGLITRKQAAELIGKNIFTLDRYARNGIITKIETAFGPRFQRSEIIAKLKIK